MLKLQNMSTLRNLKYMKRGGCFMVSILGRKR